MVAPAWISIVVGLFGTFCIGVTLMPQARMNYRHQSTHGMSLSLIILWHVAVIMCAAYYALDLLGGLFPFLSCVSCAFVSSVIEAEAFVYRPGHPSLVGSKKRLFMDSTLLCSATTAAIALFFGAFQVMPTQVSYLLGNTMPTFLIICGFVPQLWEFVADRSVEGFSFAGSALDVMGAVANVVVLLLNAESPAEAAKQAAPWLAIIGMHGVLVTFAGAIVLFCRAPCDANQPKDDQAEPEKEAADKASISMEEATTEASNSTDTAASFTEEPEVGLASI